MLSRMVTMVCLSDIDGKLLNLERLQAKSKAQTEVLDEFLFANDTAKGALRDEKIQKGVDQVSDLCDKYGLTFSIKNTEVVYRPAPGKPYKERAIRMKGQRLQVVDKFTYLGSTVSRVVHIDDGVTIRTALQTFVKKKILYGELPIVVRISDTRIPSKPPLSTWTYQQSHENRLHRI